MSTVQDFFAKVDADPALSSQYDSLDNRQAVMSFAQGLGFNFSEEEFVAHFNQGGLNLDDITGGVNSAIVSTPVSRPCPCLP